MGIFLFPAESDLYGGFQSLDNKLTLHSVADCPSLFCEELEDEETKNSQMCNTRLMKEGEVQQQILQQRDDKEAAQEEAQEKEQEVRGVKDESKVVAAETEEMEVRPDTSLEVGDVQVEDRMEMNQERETHEEEKDRKSSDKRGERKRSRKRKGRKQSERGRNRKRLKRFRVQQEENKRSQAQEMSAGSSEESSAVSEPPVPLMSSCDLSDPVYGGCGVTGLCCPPLPVLYSSQPPVFTQPAPPQAQGTKRPPSPLLAHSLPQPGPQPLEVGNVCVLTFGEPSIREGLFVIFLKWTSTVNVQLFFMSVADGDNSGLLHSPLHPLQQSGSGPGPQLLFVAWIGGHGRLPTASCTEEEDADTLQHW